MAIAPPAQLQRIRSEVAAKVQALPPEARRHSSLPILRQWAQPSPGTEGERLDATDFLREVQRRRPGGEAAIPHLTEAFVHKYLADLQALGLLEPGGAAAGEPGGQCH